MNSKNTSKPDKKPKNLYRSENDRMIAGVCGGIAEYFGYDAALVRLIFVLVILLGGSGIIAYLILWLILPTESSNYQSSEEVIKKNSEELKSTVTSIAQSVKPGSDNPQGKSVWGLFLIGFGLILLLQNFGFAHYLQLHRTWPVLLIVFGFMILSRR